MSEKKCHSCRASIDLNATECKYCGETIVAQPAQEPQAAENIFSGNPNLKPYYKEEFEKISASNGKYRGKWNWCAFFFSWIWGLTKGLWALSLLTVVTSFTVAFMGADILCLVISVAWGFTGNYWYYASQKNKK